MMAEFWLQIFWFSPTEPIDSSLNCCIQTYSLKYRNISQLSDRKHIVGVNIGSPQLSVSVDEFDCCESGDVLISVIYLIISFFLAT